ncbi:hypothetical protein XELAEV_18040710mg [Xenopus laevis]|uniref:Ig-like domain-containing protein n=1 Tax=Xenopus laevis TaxID=8355 RepID=A0A974H9B5_XENLA|nr:hypothetical protein XELAEV_18040710mg [Xenopus laevis]
MSEIIFLALNCYLLLLYTAFYIAKSGAAVRPVVSFSPNWNPIFPGEPVTLTCNVIPTAQGNLGYSWYRGGHRIPGDQQSLVIESVREIDSGVYQCQAGVSERSDSARLDLYYDRLILKATPAVHEGDSLSLKCQRRPGYDAWNPVFYKDNMTIESPVNESVLQLGRVDVTASGTYSCEEKSSFKNLKAEYYISVSELFSTPQIIVIPDQVTEGDHMTITCDTKLSPHRETTELQFVFYRNGHNVQGFSLSNQYGVPSAQLEDSGKYTCEVQTPTGSVRKRSNMEHIQIQGRHQVILRLNLLRLILSFLIFIWTVCLICHNIKTQHGIGEHPVTEED